MDKIEEAFWKELIETFRIEAGEHIAILSTELIKLEKSKSREQQLKILEIVFRSAHSLKGAARSVGQDGMELICREMESIFKKYKSDEVSKQPEEFDVLYRAVDILEQLNATSPGDEKPTVTKIVEELQTILSASTETDENPANNQPGGAEKGSAPVAAKTVENHPKASPSTISPKKPFVIRQAKDRREGQERTIRLSTEKLTRVFLQSEELIMGKLYMNRCVDRLEDLALTVDTLGKKREQVLPLHLKNIHDSIREILSEVESSRRLLYHMIDTHLADMKEILMLPFSSITGLFPRMVRDLARDNGKQIDLVIEGDEIEIDKRILEEIKDPLIHLVRNSVDHGIETPGLREEKGKSALGKLYISVTQGESGQIDVTVSDDGQGIDTLKLKQKCIQTGHLTAEEAASMDEAAILSLAFRSEVSTSPVVTDLSGRGLGLAIVQERVEKLGGKVFLENRPKQGISFHMVMPMNLATSRGILLTAGGQRFIIPTQYVKRVLRIHRDDIKTLENRETINLDDQAVSYEDLAAALGIEKQKVPGQTLLDYSIPLDYFQVMVLDTAGQVVAFHVDDIISEGEVLQKNLGPQLQSVLNIAGAAVLGSGEVIPILDPVDLVNTAIGKANQRARLAFLEPLPGKKKLLLVEDSITSRMLLQNILESSGYNVKTAVDGEDGWEALETDTFDGIISDIEMPRMDGFELTSRIKKEKKYCSLPVILVSTLDSRKDREKGIAAGADAYIVKSSFDQGNLLSVLKKLL